MSPRPLKPVLWVGSSLDDLRACPEAVQDVVGYALFLAQEGGQHPAAKRLKKATRGIATPKHELDLIKARLRWAEQDADTEVGR